MHLRRGPHFRRLVSGRTLNSLTCFDGYAPNKQIGNRLLPRNGSRAKEIEAGIIIRKAKRTCIYDDIGLPLTVETVG